ncbi:MAG: methylenetetrahydrofolate reductase [Selenomonadaceae bacterium]|nr:methylenetetrahydrofolate reductase [Selenomonadaceae bacterium]MBP3723882.1 methylenetetrahydrofolate reductase [Selenomonadaceae bacterium]
MCRISLELVPHDEEELRGVLESVTKYKDKIDVINIPDLLRLSIRSYEGAAIAKTYFGAVMPHIRAMDIDLTKPLPMKDYLREHNITEVLVIEGDAPQNMMHEIFATESTDVIRKFKAEMPEVTVYAGLDQYRSSMRHEYRRCERKILAGAAGFFTQPFFDMRYLLMYHDMLDSMKVYWGVSPVLSERSTNYWKRKNNVIFPKNFEPTLAWSVEFSRKVLDFAKENDENVYLMPIKTDLLAYVGGVLK